MPPSVTDQLIDNNRRYAAGEARHDARHPGKQAIKPSRRIAVLGCMDARLDIEDLLGLQTGEAHIIRNAGGVVSEDAIRSLLISHHLLDTKEFIVIQHTRCGMLAFTDDLLKSALEGDRQAGELVSKATSRQFVCQPSPRAAPRPFTRFAARLRRSTHRPMSPISADSPTASVAACPRSGITPGFHSMATMRSRREGSSTTSTPGYCKRSSDAGRLQKNGGPFQDRRCLCTQCSGSQNRSRFITLSQAATKSLKNLSLPSFTA